SSSSLFIITSRALFSTLSLHDALPIWIRGYGRPARLPGAGPTRAKQSNCPGERSSSANVRPFPYCKHRRASYGSAGLPASNRPRSEEHTSELQSRRDLVCRLLLEQKKS